MRTLVAFGTSEGQTRKIAAFIAKHVHERGHDVQLFDTAGSAGDLHVGSWNKIIVAGSVHQQRHQELVEIFVAAKRSELQAKPTLFLSVSLSAAFAEGMQDAQGYVSAFLRDTGWQPTRCLLVAGALRYAEYDYFKEQIIEHVVMKDRRLCEPKGDHEFTDWLSLSRAVDEFLQS